MHTMPACFTVSFLPNAMIIRMPIKANTGPGSNLMDSKRDVTVVPMLAPIITPTDWARVSNWALTKPTTITVVAPEDWIMAVTQMPVSMAITRFRVIRVRKCLSLGPAACSSPSPITRMPNRKKARPPSRVITVCTLIPCLLYRVLRFFSSESRAYRPPCILRGPLLPAFSIALTGASHSRCFKSSNRWATMY